MTLLTRRDPGPRGRRLGARLPKAALACLLPACLSLLLGACDGGLFGTGDPGVDLNVEGSGGVTDGLDSGMTDGMGSDLGGGDGTATSGSTDGTQVPNGSTDGTTGGVTDTDGTGTAPLSLTLDNLTDLGLGTAPLLHVVFFDEYGSDRQLTVTGPANDAAASDGGAVSVSIDDPVTLPLETGDNRLAVAIDVVPQTFGDLSTPTGTTPLADLAINAVAGSASTLLIASAGDTGATGAILVSNGAPGGDTTIARVRLVQMSTLGNSRATGSWRLRGSGSQPGAAETAFTGIGWMQLPAEYRDLPAGDYELVDDDARIAPIALSLQGNAVYTLLLVPDAVTPLRQVRDDSTDAWVRLPPQ